MSFAILTNPAELEEGCSHGNWHLFLFYGPVLKGAGGQKHYAGGGFELEAEVDRPDDEVTVSAATGSVRR